MFNKLKQFKDVRQQAKTLQNALSQEKITLERDGITVEVDGNQKITSMTIAENKSASQIQTAMPGVINDANDKVKKIMARKVQEMGGLPNFPGQN